MHIGEVTHAEGWIFLTCSCERTGERGPDEIACWNRPVLLDEIIEAFEDHKKEN